MENENDSNERRTWKGVLNVMQNCKCHTTEHAGFFLSISALLKQATSSATVAVGKTHCAFVGFVAKKITA